MVSFTSKVKRADSGMQSLHGCIIALKVRVNVVTDNNSEQYIKHISDLEPVGQLQGEEKPQVKLAKPKIRSRGEAGSNRLSFQPKVSISLCENMKILNIGSVAKY